MEHPLEAVIDILSTIVKAADYRVGEETKWNAPSFYIAEHFATLHTRSHDRILLVLHSGAKSNMGIRGKIDDPAELLEWRGADRAVMTFCNEDEVNERRAQVLEILRQWIAQLST